MLPFGSAAAGPLDIKLRSDSSDGLFKLGSKTVVTLQDRKGDTVAYPKPVLGLPFRDDASTAAHGARDDYHSVCGVADADAGGAPVRRAGRAGC